MRLRWEFSSNSAVWRIREAREEGGCSSKQRQKAAADALCQDDSERGIILYATETVFVLNNPFLFMEFLKTEEIHMSAHRQSGNSYVRDLLNTA